jgi:hypothetical protein
MASPDAQQMLDKLKAQGRIKPADPVQVKAKVRAYLLARGRSIAQDPGLDLDPDQASDDDLIRLAELDCIAQHPTLSPGLACTLEMVASERERMAVYTDQDRARLRAMGLDLDLGPAETAPEAGTTDRSRILDLPTPTGIDQGQGGSRARGHPKIADRNKKKNPLEQFLSEGRDRIDFPDDEE